MTLFGLFHALKFLTSNTVLCHCCACLTCRTLLCQVLKPYQTVGNPLSKRECLNGFHSHFLLVDDGTLGKSGGQLDLRKRLERHIRSQKIHPSECVCYMHNHYGGRLTPRVCVWIHDSYAKFCFILLSEQMGFSASFSIVQMSVGA